MICKLILKTLIRIFHPYWKWEETKFNMWGDVKDREKYFKKAIEFTGNHKLYGKFMMKVVKEWKYSCEHNLSNISSNRQAYIGHAACALAFKCPEDIVRLAWHELTDNQRELANKQADKAIKFWEENYAKN
jgi:hypothetical protein